MVNRGRQDLSGFSRSSGKGQTVVRVLSWKLQQPSLSLGVERRKNKNSADFENGACAIWANAGQALCVLPLFGSKSGEEVKHQLLGDSDPS